MAIEDDKKKTEQENPEVESLSLDDLSEVSGGSLRNVPKRETKDITDSMKEKI